MTMVRPTATALTQSAAASASLASISWSYGARLRISERRSLA